METLGSRGAFPSVEALVSVAGRPAQLCIGVSLQNVHLPYGRQPGFNTVLGSSDDAGKTWRYLPVTHVQDDLRFSSASPLMDASGACYLSVAPLIGPSTVALSERVLDTTVYRLRPGTDAPLEVAATLPRQEAWLGGMYTAQGAKATLALLWSAPITPISQDAPLSVAPYAFSAITISP